MKSELVSEYKKLLEQVFNLSGEKESEDIVAKIENLNDPAREVMEDYIEKRANLPNPIHWIALLRLFRLTSVHKREIQSRYDSFVNAYQEMSNRPGTLNSEESHLLKEIGDFLYHVDELYGEQERFGQKLILGIRQGILEEYGVNLDLNDDFYRLRIGEEAQQKIAPLLAELYQILDRLQDQIKIMSALDRLRNIMNKKR